MSSLFTTVATTVVTPQTDADVRRLEIFEAIADERDHQDDKWGEDFDALNTPNDWVAYITAYAGKGVTLPFNEPLFRASMLKVAALAVAILERDNYAPRHYDQ